MDNKIKSKTRLVAIQIISQHLFNNDSIDDIKDDFDKYYRNTKIDKNSDKIQYNVNFLSKLLIYYKNLDLKIISKKINNLINFDRKYEKWDKINQAIILVSFAELYNSEKNKIKIILNDYIDISKYFVNLKETKFLNAILDKLINEKE